MSTKHCCFELCHIRYLKLSLLWLSKYSTDKLIMKNMNTVNKVRDIAMITDFVSKSEVIDATNKLYPHV